MDTMQDTTVKKESLKNARSVRRQAINLQDAGSVAEGYLQSGQLLPLTLQPNCTPFDLAGWAYSNLDYLDTALQKHGAILFRGFAVESVSVFERFAQTFSADLFNENGEHQRESLSGNVYTPVFYPPDKQLLWHNENSFNNSWPMKIWFGCLTPPHQGGETPLVDSRRVYDRIEPRIRELFIEKKVMYVRNYGDGLGLSWEKVFRTTSKGEVEEHCRTASISCEWKDGNRLRTRSIRPAVLKHPKSGEYAWFNQAQHWHPSCLDAAVRESLNSLFSDQNLPRNCYYGDGTVIEDSVMASICEAYRELEVSFPWERGDVLMLDNILTAHGRNPYLGERKLLVAMGDMGSYETL